MRFVVLFAALAATPATAQQFQLQPLPQPQTTYDWQSGNSYTVTPQYGGGARVQGYNFGNGSMWNQTIQPNGNMQGTDAQGNFWTYNEGSKTYMNFGTGKMCVGEGMGRICN